MPRPPLMALFLRISCVFFKTVWRSQKKEGWLAQKVPVKKIYYPWKFSDFCPWKRFFARAKNQKLAREKKIRAWKKLKKPKNTGVKNAFCPWKKRKRAKKRLSRPLFFSRPKKKALGRGGGGVRALKLKICVSSFFLVCVYVGGRGNTYFETHILKIYFNREMQFLSFVFP